MVASLRPKIDTDGSTNRPPEKIVARLPGHVVLGVVATVVVGAECGCGPLNLDGSGPGGDRHEAHGGVVGTGDRRKPRTGAVGRES